MSLFIASICSGSNGNCYYVGNSNEGILVDAGISCREIEARMKRLGLSMQKIKAIFVSHEHTDHVKGICALVKKYRLPVYITTPTLIACNFKIDDSCLKTFRSNEAIRIGDLSITAFVKCHDACDPYSFIIESNHIKVGVFTDLGTPCENLIKYFKQCHGAFLEANFDEQMLAQGNYPYYLKKRISGGQGHLSNTQALSVFTRYKPNFMTHLVLSHLSKNNNCPKLVQKLFDDQADGVKIVVASRFKESEVYEINDYQMNKPKSKNLQLTPAQLTFAF